MLLEAARAAARHAYAPYSNFPVGAAVRTSTGEVFTGCNVENAAYGSTLCAERGAVMAMVAAGFRSVEAVAVVGPDGPCWPCGACRQVLAEFGCRRVLVDGAEVAFEDLLPRVFGKLNKSE
ncbi:MAG: cytidine deaminase [Corynebacterium sp.]|uniref:cytidine deaminase n=1 Tax=Corynebacterium sp. TaxID=1720 RepID=UPI0026DF3BE3|nr:cytidine deaminase [Corynebacterium sp.]MDO5671084.1 cytidine deaminase [Corynebacterium sp.]